MQVMSKYGECLLPIDGEIRPRNWLPGNMFAILGCPNLEVPASDDQPCCGETTIAERPYSTKLLVLASCLDL